MRIRLNTKKQRDIWKFNDDEWKVHISDDKVKNWLIGLIYGVLLYTMKMVDYLKRLLGM